jgi:2-polyprenyl-3-methyl-5-hydroxy-6-metoxy-1,4-benzoquinol methylase
LTEESTLETTFESSPCEICGCDERELIVSRPDFFLGNDALYCMHECASCEAIYQHPRPKPVKMMEFYPSNYQQYTPALTNESRWRRFFRNYGLWKRAALIGNYVQWSRLLDVGCATGDFLAFVRHKGQVIGLEPVHSAAQCARHQVGSVVVRAVLNTSPFSNESFDVVTLWDVLEHVYDPRRVIDEASRILRVGGILVVNHPNLDSIDRYIFGKFWLGYELPRHLYLFPTKLLRQLMSEYGLEQIERKCLYGSHAATASTVMFIVERFFGKSLVSRFIRTVIFSQVVRLLAAPYFKLIDHCRLGSNVTVVFRRKS